MHVTAWRDLSRRLVYIDLVGLYYDSSTSGFRVRVDSYADFPLQMNDGGIPLFLNLLCLCAHDPFGHGYIKMFYLVGVVSAGALRNRIWRNERDRRYS